MNQQEFISGLAQRHIPVTHQSETELENELQQFDS
jgi:hypothetical protein